MRKQNFAQSYITQETTCKKLWYQILIGLRWNIAMTSCKTTWCMTSFYTAKSRQSDDWECWFERESFIFFHLLVPLVLYWLSRDTGNVQRTSIKISLMKKNPAILLVDNWNSYIFYLSEKNALDFLDFIPCTPGIKKDLNACWTRKWRTWLVCH